jgi:ABC-type glycerol-3-phosphate transport system substrate-binding protein
MEAGMKVLQRTIRQVAMLAAGGMAAAAVMLPTTAQAQDLQGTLRVAANGWIIQKFPVQVAADDFMKKHPKVKVEVIPNDDDTFVNQYLLEWAHGHNPADLGIGGTPGQLASFVAKGYLVPWTDFFTGAFAKDKFVPAYLQSGVFKGVQYTLPFLGEVMMFSVNKPMLKTAGLLGADGEATAPQTWADLPAFCKKLTEANGGKPGCSIHWGFSFAAYNYMTCLLGEQGTFYEKGTKIIDFSSKAAHDCLAVGRQMISDGTSMPESVSDDNGGRRAYVAGAVGALLEAASREAEAAATLGADKVGLMAAPGTEKNGTIVFSHAVYIPKADTANARTLALAFVREEILTPEFAQPGLKRFGKLPTYLPAWKGLESDPTYKLVLSVIARGVNAPAYAGYDQLDTYMQQQIGKAVLGTESVDAALKTLHDQIRTVNLTDLAAAH